MMSTAAIQALREAFIAAPLVPDGWERALRDMARLTNSARGQLVAFDGGPVAAMDIISDFDYAQFEKQFAEIGGGRADGNWRIHACRAPMTIVAEQDYAQARRERNFELYDDFVHAADIVAGCHTVLFQEQGSLFGLATLRTRADGLSSQDDLAVFAAVASAAQTGVRLQRSLAYQGIQLATGALEAVDAAAILLNRRGEMIAKTRAAEDILSAQSHAAGRGRMLSAVKPGSDRALQAAIGHALNAGDAAAPDFIWLDAGQPGQAGRACEIFALPCRDWQLGDTPSVLVSFPRPKNFDERHERLLRQGMGLSGAEAQVAILSARGLSREQIARARGVSIDTVAAQLKTIYRKTDVRHGGGLVALLRDIL